MTTIPLDLRLTGRTRNDLMPVDDDDLMRCKRPEHREAFDAVIDVRFSDHKPDSKRTRGAIAQAKAVCKGHKPSGLAACPMIAQCMTVHGRDYELGVIAGETDGERAIRFGATA